MTTFDTDNEGNVILMPVTGWAAGPVAEIDILLRIEYQDPHADSEIAGKAIQFVLTPHKALQLAEALSRQAKRLLEEKLPPN